MSLAHLQPTTLWSIFEKLNACPRPSSHEQKVMSEIAAFCDQHQLHYVYDDIGNMIIRKPATPGMEDRPGIIMQGHVDMVPQKTKNSEHDFINDPIQMYIDGDWVTAKDTTLGADNGIGVAAALAILIEPDLQHGPLEVLLTVDEESGMTGAKHLAPNLLQGSVLLNLDTEDEGELYLGCAGGVDVTAYVPLQKQPVPNNWSAVKVNFSGLRGGHSGLDIDKGRANANLLINQVLANAHAHFGALGFSFSGGTLRNAIARDASVEMVLPADKVAELTSVIETFTETLSQQFQGIESAINGEIQAIPIPSEVWDEATTARVISMLDHCVHGVTKMSEVFDGVVETSNNLAVIETQPEQLVIQCMVRSLNNQGRDELAQQLQQGLSQLGATVECSGEYPGWLPNDESKVLTIMQQAHEELTGAAAKVKVIHAGLECGLLSEHYPHWDMISFGPTIRHAHSPDEKVLIPSVSSFWQLLCKTICMVSEKY
ncbi:aminoacyl-histidine dipeptidase [Pleionea litopenaei]|uniref:Cytosol non-specific dipeptidase n=1 Tax=Pleionea litopenaei TaxID=3070815 RepID=A0AA51X691_9GAMM|nr:aminoacyl-histidine dipeptidase [Pleionea sp. HL-JVS1]WMS86873.1 aminoacyl-histidine dipeptidase [Pleionea sp. HL-JVS1]